MWHLHSAAAAAVVFVAVVNAVPDYDAWKMAAGAVDDAVDAFDDAGDGR